MKIDAKVMIGFFIIALIGLIFVDVLGDQVATNTQTAAVTNETFTGLIGQRVQLAKTDLIDGSVTVWNSSTKVLVENTDYTVYYATGQVNISTPQLNNTNYNITYGYYPSTYVKSNSARSLVSLNTLFFALGLVIIIAAVILKFYNDFS